MSQRKGNWRLDRTTKKEKIVCSQKAEKGMNESSVLSSTNDIESDITGVTNIDQH